MNKAERGTKRVCAECGGKFYDLNKDPIVCPVCETIFVPEESATPAPKPVEEPAKKVVEETKQPEEVAVESDDAPEFVSLEDADKEQGGGDDDIDVDDAVIADLDNDSEDLPDSEDDDKFLEEDDEEGSDVSDILPAKVDSAEDT